MANTVDPRYMLRFGVSMATLSQLVASELTAQAGFYDLVWPNLIRSVGLGFVFIPVSVAALSDLSPQIPGGATGLFNLTRELGGFRLTMASIGLRLVTILLLEKPPARGDGGSAASGAH